MRKFPLTQAINNYLEKINNEFDIKIPPNDVNEGWTTELHLDNSAWLNNVYDKINNGLLLVIDYAIEANKYYSNERQGWNVNCHTKIKSHFLMIFFRIQAIAI